MRILASQIRRDLLTVVVLFVDDVLQSGEGITLKALNDICREEITNSERYSYVIVSLRLFRTLLFGGFGVVNMNPMSPL